MNEATSTLTRADWVGPSTPVIEVATVVLFDCPQPLLEPELILLGLTHALSRSNLEPTTCWRPLRVNLVLKY